jgi:hypothetical protein
MLSLGSFFLQYAIEIKWPIAIWLFHSGVQNGIAFFRRNSDLKLFRRMFEKGDPEPGTRASLTSGS